MNTGPATKPLLPNPDEGDRRYRRRQTVLRVALYALFAVAGLSYQSHGLPERWGADELDPVVYDMHVRDSLNPRHFNYPAGMLFYLSHFTLKAVQWFDPSLVIDHGTTTQVCRTVNLFFYLLTLLCIEGAVRTLTGRRYVPFALFMAGTTCGLLHHAHVGESNPSYFFGISLAVYQFSRTLRSKRPHDFFLSVCACGLAVGCKYNAIHLFAALPALWLLCFRPYRWGTFFKHLGISLILAPLPFYLTNPYMALDWAKGFGDMYNVAVVEAPWYQSSLRWSSYAATIYTHWRGFFSPTVNLFMSATVVVGVATVVSLRFTRRPTTPEDRLAVEGLSVLGVLFLAYALLTYKIAIFQSRYLIPLGLYYSFVFLVLWYWLPAQWGAYLTRCAEGVLGNGWGLPLRRAATATRHLAVGYLVLLLACTGLAQVHAYAAAPRALATQFVHDKLKQSKRERVGLVVFPRRSAIRRSHPEIEARLDTFTTMDPPQDLTVDTWPKYLGTIEEYFRRSDVNWLLMEDIITTWTVFLPLKDVNNSEKRYQHPNPGLEEWKRHLHAAGFQMERTISGADPHVGFARVLRKLLGNDYLRVCESSGGVVYVFRRHAGKVASNHASSTP